MAVLPPGNIESELGSFLVKAFHDTNVETPRAAMKKYVEVSVLPKPKAMIDDSTKKKADAKN